MIEQKDIDRLLAGRKIIDEIRCIDVLVLGEKRTAIAKEVIPMLTKTEVIAAKTEVDALYEDEKQSILDAEKKLADLGFSGIGEFLEFNKTMCLDEYIECNPIEGKCDGCEGYETKPPCVEKYGGNACALTKPEIPQKVIYEVALRGRRRGESIIVDNRIYLVCPPGHGFYLDINKIKASRFDLRWRNG